MTRVPRKRRKGIKWLTLPLAVIAGLVMVWCMVRAYRIEEYRRELVARGFPHSYAAPLSRLQYAHPKWKFVPMPINDLSWWQIVDKETEPSWNLVVNANWAPDKWNALKSANYTPYYARNAKAYDSGAWYQASREAIAYFMDPRNFLNKYDIFMFETLGYDVDSQNERAVERTLADTFMAKANYDGGNRRFSQLIMEVGRDLGVSPVFIAGRLASEQGRGSVQAFGTIGDALAMYCTNSSGRIGNAVIWGKRFAQDNAATKKVMDKGADAYNGYYNFFNFRAYGLGLFEIKYNAWVEATAKETAEKYDGPWTTQERAIKGGARKLKELYIDSSRHTRYLQKFSVSPRAGIYRWKQYMQNIAAPLIESRNTAKTYSSIGEMKSTHRFLIPVFKDMPASPCADPARGNSVYSPSH